jgi:hypothetical protein
MVFIHAYQEQGHISRCVHALPTVITTHGEARYYGVRCARDSFNIRRPQPGTFKPGTLGPPPVPFAFYGCPDGCHFRQNAWQARLQRLGEVPGRLLSWFLAESWQVKVAVLALVGVLIMAIRGAEALRALAELVRAVIGK